MHLRNLRAPVGAPSQHRHGFPFMQGLDGTPTAEAGVSTLWPLVTELSLQPRPLPRRSGLGRVAVEGPLGVGAEC